MTAPASAVTKHHHADYPMFCESTTGPMCCALATSAPHSIPREREMSMTPLKALLVIVAVLIGIIIAQMAGFLARAGGAELPAAISKGGVAFAGTVTLALLIMASLGLF
ncbi:hypothetical protein ACQPYK_02640 [Streptosporangium sp. CA-135522]|uniref:hypothetical protein n=1 Tax=Streptosporangium sp. CA-135522 TaxID=3240072 RepID=UPI003D8A4B99